jgi:hypothetical protein
VRDGGLTFCQVVREHAFEWELFASDGERALRQALRKPAAAISSA